MAAQKLPKQEAEKARKRKQRKASKNQYRITEETLFCAGWMVVITSLGIEYSGKEIIYLYRSRWQAELLFKRFKQNFAVTKIKAGSTSYAETEVLLWLIIWTMAEQQAFLAECYIEGKEEIYSVYGKCKIAFLQIKEILCLSWSLFINLSDKKYFRSLSKKKRRRNNQNEEFHRTVLPGLFA